MWTTTEMLGVTCNILIDLDVTRKVSVENNLVDKATATSSATKQAMFPSHLAVKVCSQVKFILLTIQALPPPSQQKKLPTLSAPLQFFSLMHEVPRGSAHGGRAGVPKKSEQNYKFCM